MFYIFHQFVWSLKWPLKGQHSHFRQAFSSSFYFWWETSNFIKISKLFTGCCAEDSDDFHWTENICFMCRLCCVFRLRHRSKWLVLFIFVVLVPFLCRQFLPTVLQMVRVHSSLCTCSILFCLHPLSIWLLFFLFAVFTCAMYTHGFWSVYVTILKLIYHHNSEDQCWATENLLIYTC